MGFELRGRKEVFLIWRGYGVLLRGKGSIEKVILLNLLCGYLSWVFFSVCYFVL